MRTRFTWIGIIAIFLGVIGILNTSCKEDLNEMVEYYGKVVYINTTTAFPDLTVKVTDGKNIHCQAQTDAGGLFRLTVRVNEINGNYYLLVGDSTCVPKQVPLSGYGQAEIDLGVIEVEGPALPSVTTENISNVSDREATCGGNVTKDGRASVTARGVCWSKSEYPTIDDEHTINGSGLGEFKSQITNLEPGATYYVRAYATNRIGTAYGEQLTLSSKTGLPQVTTDEVTNISATSATCGGEVAANSGYAITARGVCWSSTTASPTINNNHTEEVATTGHFTSMMIGLERNTTYYVRAYAANEKGTNYGETKIFTTLSGLPAVTTSEVTNIKTTTAIGGGNVTSNGGYTITARGICWSSTSSTPTPEDNHTNEVADNGVFSSLMTGLEANTTYYVRAYATNEVGTAYGKSVIFTSGNGLPSVETIDPGENITSSSIGAVGNVTDDGGYMVIVRGFVYSTLPYPTLTNGTNITSGSGVGYFSANITGITPTKNTYYIRAYATNAQGTAYGEQVVITPERSEYINLQTINYGGYTYKIKPLGEMSWDDGNTACLNMIYGGYSDWFMPDEGVVLSILQLKKVWQTYAYEEYSYNLYVYGFSSLWTSTKGSNEEISYYYIDCGWQCKWYRGSTDEKSTLIGVIAVRKYRTENQ